MAERKIQFLPSGVDPVPVGENTRAAAPVGDASALWREVLGRLDDDVAHQAFIRACLSEGRLRFALDSYRTLESLRPGDPVAARYLGQVAKAMEFGALGVQASRKIDLETNKLLSRPMRVVAALVIALGGMAIIYGIIQVARSSLAN